MTLATDRSGPDVEPLDPAQQSLAEALRGSFGILKAAMVVALVAYAFSGTFSVGSNEVALRLRFGDYVGGPGQRVLERGTYLAAPFPLEQVVKIDTRPMTPPIDDAFWYDSGERDPGMTRAQIRHSRARPLTPSRTGPPVPGAYYNSTRTRPAPYTSSCSAVY